MFPRITKEDAFIFYASFQLQIGDSSAVTKMVDHVPFPAIKVVVLEEVLAAAPDHVVPVDLSMLVFRLVTGHLQVFSEVGYLLQLEAKVFNPCDFFH